MYIRCLSYQIMSLKSNFNDSLHDFPPTAIWIFGSPLSPYTSIFLFLYRDIYLFCFILLKLCQYSRMGSVWFVLFICFPLISFLHAFSNQTTIANAFTTNQPLSLCSCSSSFFVCNFSSQVLQYWCHKPYYLYWFGELLHRRVKPFHF